MRRCRYCGSNNPDSSEICKDCGELFPTDHSGPEVAAQVEDDSSLVSSMPTAGAHARLQTSAQAEASIEASPASSTDRTQPLKPPERSKPGTKSKGHAKLVITRGASIGVEFALVAPESTIGRWDADGGVFPDVDLDRFDPESKISRKHARILLAEGRYTVEDLGSTNGTFINRGRRLLPGSTHPLSHGDELIIGKTFLKFLIES